MKKLFLTLSILLTTGSLIACTDIGNNETQSETEETKQEDGVREKNNEVDYEIPNDNWDLSSTFEHSVVYESGEEGSYTIVGNKDSFGFTGPFPIIAKDNQKYFWFYFGNENIYDKSVEVKAIKDGEEELIDVYSGTFNESAEVSSDSVNMPSHLKFPSAGVWKVLVYINEELYESIVVEVE